jgi:RNA polymerase sigma-70 factor, ECF subfamily
MSMAAEPRSDPELVEAIAAGDTGALAELYRRHAPWLQVRLSRRCSDQEAVDDALQDVFVAVWRSAGRFRPTAEVAAWLWGIAIRRLISSLRRSRPFATLMTAPPASRVASAEDLVLLGVEHGNLGSALARLSPELRAVVQATVLDGLTVREASELLGIPAGTVKTRLARAKARLRESLA